MYVYKHNLCLLIVYSSDRGRSRNFTHQSNAEGVSHARGVQGHAPRENFEI